MVCAAAGELSITYGNQGESARGGCYGGGWTSTRLKRLTNRIPIQFPASDCHQRPRHCPYHVTQEPLSTDANLDQETMRSFVRSLQYLHTCHSANAILNI